LKCASNFSIFLPELLFNMKLKNEVTAWRLAKMIWNHDISNIYIITTKYTNQNRQFSLNFIIINILPGVFFKYVQMAEKIVNIQYCEQKNQPKLMNLCKLNFKF